MSTAVQARRWLAPEVVQTSAMDCGPAALKCLLEGHGLPIHYGRLREACQTSLDGTSIDTLEEVAGALGLQAEQVLIPADHLLQPEAQALPALVLVKQADGAAHFVVLWRRFGPWLQVMDPATGRRWVRERPFLQDLLRHRMSLPAADWRAWAASADNLGPLRARLRGLGARQTATDRLQRLALADAGWFGLGALDASVRMVDTVVRAGGVAAGPAAVRLVQALFGRTRQARHDVFAHVPAAYWSAVPDVEAQAAYERAGHHAAPGQPLRQHLQVQGAVLLRVRAHAGNATLGEGPGATEPTDSSPASEAPPPALTPALRAALAERQAHPLATIWGLLRQDGLLGPSALLGAMALAAGAVVAQALLFRGLFDIAAQLALPSQRLLGLLALLGFAALLLALELPIVSESLRYGRHLETRLRMALLAKLPRLNDRYFQSRSVSDMAERGHSIQLARNVPMLGLNFVQTLAELLLTLLGVAWIAPHSAPWALAIVAAAVAVPAVLQPLLNERDLRLRSQTAALGAFYLDALLGLVPVRTHRAERAVSREHESLLVAWVRASRSTAAAAVAASGLQGLLCQGLAVLLLVLHFRSSGGVGGGDLLLIYWALKLPSLGSGVGALARQYPVQRNVLLRLFEPLTAPEDTPAAGPRGDEPAAVPRRRVAGVSIDIAHGRVLAGGHEILRHVNLRIAPGEHVAVVGASGAGKSSLVGLLLGWHRLAGGSLLVDGAPLQGPAQERLRRETAWVDPGVQLWNRSFLDNLAYASPEEARTRTGAAVKAAQLSSVLAQLPQGLQTPLGEGGTRLSGGEGQRVRLGRAMLQPRAGAADGPPVRLALLDEPFRGLDRAQRQGLLAQARQWWQGSTMLCVTHDLEETRAFDRVLVVDAGCIVEDGTPAELAARPGSCYAQMLAEEARLRSRLWRTDPTTGAGGADGWRHLRVEQGRVVPAPLGAPGAPPSGEMAA